MKVQPTREGLGAYRSARWDFDGGSMLIESLPFSRRLKGDPWLRLGERIGIGKLEYIIASSEPFTYGTDRRGIFGRIYGLKGETK